MLAKRLASREWPTAALGMIDESLAGLLQTRSKVVDSKMPADRLATGLPKSGCQRGVQTEAIYLGGEAGAVLWIDHQKVNSVPKILRPQSRGASHNHRLSTRECLETDTLSDGHWVVLQRDDDANRAPV